MGELQPDHSPLQYVFYLMNARFLKGVKIKKARFSSDLVTLSR